MCFNMLAQFNLFFIFLQKLWCRKKNSTSVFCNSKYIKTPFLKIAQQSEVTLEHLDLV